VRLLTIDSSVFVSAARQSEVRNAESTTFLAWVRESRPRLFLPTLLMAEVSAALSRTGTAAGLAQRYALAIGQKRRLVTISLQKAICLTPPTLKQRRTAESGHDGSVTAAFVLNVKMPASNCAPQEHSARSIVLRYGPRFPERAP
jgi:predicted nucleic acid-binding protein